MRTKTATVATAALILAIAGGLAAADKGQAQMPERYKKWLDEDVVYIITPGERDVFKKLATDRERDMFMEAFWNHRDPTPGTPDNEFRTEHYRRINYATRYLGRESPIPGWKTDRGRIYIILGEPNDITRMQGKGDVYNCEIWFYQGKTDAGLPAGFNLLFFQEQGQGMYKLYSPVNDGPQALMPTYQGSMTDYQAAYQALQDIDPTLANVAMSLIPGEGYAVYGRPSLVSDMMIQRIETSPQRMVEDKYARKFLEYKDLVEVEYSANYLESDALVKVLRDRSGMTFVHYAIEPKRLSVNNYENKYYTVLKVNGSVTTMDGRPVHQFDKTVNIEMTEDDLKDRGNRPFDFRDVFPIVPGDYRLTLLVKNEASKEFTSLEQALHIPADGPAPLMTSLLLAYKVDAPDTQDPRVRPFELASRQVHSQPGRVFASKDTLSIAFQLLGLGPDLRAKAEVKTIFLKDEQPFKEMVHKVSEYATLPDVIQDVPLADFPPAHYRVQVALVSDGAEVVSVKDEFDVTYLAGVARPWVYSRVLPDPADPLYGRVLGLQLFNLGRLEEAREKLEQSHAQKPSEDSAIELARVRVALKDTASVEALLAPYLGQEKPARYETFLLAARASRMQGSFARAIEIYDRAVAHYGVNPNLLNAIGECYLGLGKPAEAQAVWEKSLELNADQPEVRKQVERLKTKKDS